MIAPKINPTLKTGAGSTAGARAGSPVAADKSMVAKRQKSAEEGTLRVSLNLDGRRRRVNPPRLVTAKADASGSPATAGADGSPGRTTAATTIPSDNDDENEPIEAAVLTTTRKLRKGGRVTIDDQPSTGHKLMLVTALAGRHGVATKEGAVARVGMFTGTFLTMDDDNVHIDDKSGNNVDDNVDDKFDDNEDVDDDNPSTAMTPLVLLAAPLVVWHPLAGFVPRGFARWPK